MRINNMITKDEWLAIIRDNIKEMCDAVYSCEHDFNRAAEGIYYAVHTLHSISQYNMAAAAESIIGLGNVPYIRKLCVQMWERRFDGEGVHVNAMCKAALVCEENLDDFRVLGILHNEYDKYFRFVCDVAFYSSADIYKRKYMLEKLEDFCRIICNIMQRCY